MTEIIQPGEIRPPAQEAPFVRLADPRTLFARRSARFMQLAAGHPLEGFLRFMSHLTRAQQDTLDALPSHGGSIDARVIAEARRLGRPVFPAAQDLPEGTLREPAHPHVTDAVVDRLDRPEISWQTLLLQILQRLEEVPDPTRTAMATLQALPQATLEQLAHSLLGDSMYPLDPAQAPLIAAALQVFWVHRATRLDAAAFGMVGTHPEPHPGDCPVCGSPPTASVVRIGGVQQGLRYLHCSLCETEWHRVRVQCNHCGNTTGIEYLGIAEDAGVVKAETCAECHTYLKILYQDKDLAVDPVADDLASLGLDLLMAEESCLRSGPSLFFMPGPEPEATH